MIKHIRYLSIRSCIGSCRVIHRTYANGNGRTTQCRVGTTARSTLGARRHTPALTTTLHANSCLSGGPVIHNISCRELSSSSSLTVGEEEVVESLAADILSRNDNMPNENRGLDGQKNDMSRRIALSKAITLVESKSPRKRLMADALLSKLRQQCAPERRIVPSFRLGIAGPPGVGKSTFVESLGLHILGLKGNENDRTGDPFRPDKLAVLCIDPSSHVTGGSILGDKTRMSNLSHHPRGYVRPSPSSGTLGGLGSYTYDAASLCELAGYQMTIIETVGVGQSEVELAECCDLFLLLLAPEGGDELQGSKKGIIEVADVLVVNKADGETANLARRTANEYKKAMGLLRKPSGWWAGTQQGKEDGADSSCEQPMAPPVMLVSAKAGTGVPELWKTIVEYHDYAHSSGQLIEKRRRQNRYWMWKYLRERVLETAKGPRVKKKAEMIEQLLDVGAMAPREAAGELWKNIIATDS